MTYDEVLTQVLDLLQRDQRVAYRVLKRRFDLDNEYIEDLKADLIKAKRLAADEEGEVLVWLGESEASTPNTQASTSIASSAQPIAPDAERRQLTVMFCDLVGSTPMSAQLDPEDYRDIMQAYQEMCGQVLARFTGHIARYEGDGILVYFGYPRAQEDAAVQAVRASLQIIAGLPSLNARFQPRFPFLQERPLQVRIGLHTGLVVVGEMGSEQYRIDIAVGETPNMAARIQGQAGPKADTLALLAALLSLPHPESLPPLTMSPQKQKEVTLAAFVAWLIEETERQPVYNAWEDLHWADPSTLEILDLLLTQVPTSRLLAVLTFRPEFNPPWGTHSYLSHLTLNRLAHPQVSAMVGRVTGGKLLPEVVVEQIVTKTDGVPLFVEELTKMAVESNLVSEVNGHYELTGPLPPLAIPSTLQDSLMARLDRLATVREVAQLGATIGREFSYELLHAVSPLDEAVLQQGLQQLVEAELVFQRGLPPQAHYVFKHALIQDTAYESLLKSTRQQYHQQIAQVLGEQFSDTIEIRPELIAHHYTEAGLREQTIPYWYRAGERALEHSANVEAVNLWFLGYPDQGLRRSGEAVTLAREVSHSYSLGYSLDATAWVHRLRREGPATQEQAEVLMTFANEQGFTQLVPEGTTFRGWALSEQGQEEEGMAQIRQGLANKSNLGNYVQRRAWRVCGTGRIRMPKPISYSLRSTTGSPKALTPKIYRRRKPCWTSYTKIGNSLSHRRTECPTIRSKTKLRLLALAKPSITKPARRRSVSFNSPWKRFKRRLPMQACASKMSMVSPRIAMTETIPPGWLRL